MAAHFTRRSWPPAAPSRAITETLTPPLATTHTPSADAIRKKIAQAQGNIRHDGATPLERARNLLESIDVCHQMYVESGEANAVGEEAVAIEQEIHGASHRAAPGPAPSESERVAAARACFDRKG